MHAIYAIVLNRCAAWLYSGMSAMSWWSWYRQPKRTKSVTLSEKNGYTDISRASGICLHTMIQFHGTKTWSELSKRLVNNIICGACRNSFQERKFFGWLAAIAYSLASARIRYFDWLLVCIRHNDFGTRSNHLSLFMVSRYPPLGSLAVQAPSLTPQLVHVSPATCHNLSLFKGI